MGGAAALSGAAWAGPALACVVGALALGSDAGDPVQAGKHPAPCAPTADINTTFRLYQRLTASIQERYHDLGPGSNAIGEPAQGWP